MKKIISFFCFFYWSLLLLAQANPTEKFNSANKSYQAKKYSESIQLYEDLRKEGYQSVELYYNLGNSYYQNNQIGSAILNYERALTLDRGNKDVKFNLNLAQAKQKDELSEIPGFFLSSWWNGLKNTASSTTWGVIGLLLLWAGVGGLIFWLLGKERAVRKKGFIAGLSILFLCILPFLLSFGRKKTEQDSGVAILIEKEIPVRSAPDKESVDILLLHEGAKLDILDQIGEWYKVRLINGEEGWLPIAALEKI